MKRLLVNQADWRFEDGEIHGRKLTKVNPRRIIVRLVHRGGIVVLEAPRGTLDPEAIGKAVEEERNSR